jgi:hypothetical protein
MKTKIIVIITMILLEATSVYAKIISQSSLNANIEALSFEDHVIYSDTISMCQGPTSHEYAEKAKVWYESFMNSGILETTYRKINSSDSYVFAISDHLKDLTSSQGYFLAIDKCFGGDDERKLLFFYSLLALDMSGKLTVWASDLSLIRPLMVGMLSLRATVHLPLWVKWFWFRHFFELTLTRTTPTLSRIFGVAAWKFFSGIFITADLGNEYQSSIEHKSKEMIFSGKTPEVIEDYKKEIEYYKKIKSTLQNQIDIETINLLINQDEETLKRMQN